ncbi:hypothetical protein D5S18_02925 [Nocardia panacis]|uniref:Uncharacterized protein n=1 Tax=Nocardia panacis TaxID=2340916 RepID=A0A3A4KVN3_9NOCA|nr:hypothetical protein D5S18_02925 [Nocardia panacis]
MVLPLGRRVPGRVRLNLEFLNGADGKVGDKWVFTISGEWASVRTQYEIHSVILSRTLYRLVFADDNTTPPDRSVLQFGYVKRWPQQ